MERNYDFCKRLLEVHKKNRRNKALMPNSDEFAFENTVRVLMPRDAGEITVTAAKDFADYLFTSMNVTAYVDYDNGEDCPNTVRLALADDLGDANERRGHRVTIGENVKVEGYDEAGIMQGLFYLEDVMNLREAPFLKKGTETRRIMFAPRTVMSGYGVGEYPDEYLASLAHHGFSAIMLWIKGINESQKGYQNFKDLAVRAGRYGFDIYVESYTKHEVYPEGEEAQEFYDRLYGDLFAEFPFIKGLVIVGEAVKFPSRDPDLPQGKNPGWWPCSDWPLLLKMIQNAVRKVKPDVEVILSSYNWGYCDYKLRQKLISNLPEGVLLNCGWEMFEKFDLDGVEERCADYSLRVVKPGHYFLTEAEAATKYGIKLETIANTGGKTWDFGAIPFDPAPYRWAERCEELRKAHDNNNLAALLDSIHYGVYPSFITEITKWAFAEPRVDLQELIPKILAMHFGHEEIDKVDRAMHLWSDALANMVPTNLDQYGALRVGPGHPFYVHIEGRELVEVKGHMQLPYQPQDKFAMHKLGPGMYLNYAGWRTPDGKDNPNMVKGIESYERVRDYLAEGIEILETVENKNEELLRLINMGRFMYRTILSALNRRHLYVLDDRRLHETDSAKRKEIVEKMVAIMLDERQNAVDTIPITEYDSVLGFEPSIEYVTDRKRLEWKIAQVDREIELLKAEK